MTFTGYTHLSLHLVYPSGRENPVQPVDFRPSLSLVTDSIDQSEFQAVVRPECRVGQQSLYCLENTRMRIRLIMLPFRGM